MEFKIGDRVMVRETDRTCKDYKGKMGRITEVDRIKRGLSNSWDFQVTFDDGFTYPFSPQEVLIRNQQLLFSFMEK